MVRDQLEILIPDMHEELCQLLLQIPSRKVTTYGDLAKALGSVRASRWVSMHLNQSVNPDEYPTHRVIKATGELGTFSQGNVDLKRELLIHEKIQIQNEKIDLSRYLFNDFRSDQPLVKLKNEQDKVRTRIRLSQFGNKLETVGAVDVSYNSRDESFATYAVVDVRSQELIWSRTESLEFTFPYIPGFLAYRELPVYFKLIQAVRKEKQLAPVTLVDGNGMLHPQKAGIACQLGVYTGLKTIGVAKSLLCGKISDQKSGSSSLIEWEGEFPGAAIYPQGSKKPLYVSPGNGPDLESSLRIVKAVMSDHRLPEPIYHADRISRLNAKGESP